MSSSKTVTLLDQTVRLVDLLNRRSPEGAALLQSLYREPLIRFCYGYLAHMEDAEDAVQEICLKVIQAPAVPGHFRPWIYKIARNHCLKRARRIQARNDGPVPQPSQIPDVITGQLTRMANDEVRAKMTEAFGRLPEEQREVLRLRYVEDLSRAEIAEVLDISESLVKSRLFEGLQRLRQEAAKFEQR